MGIKPPNAAVIAAYTTRLIMSGLIWTWINKMRSATCACSGTWKREFLYYSLPADLVARLALYAVYDRVPSFVKAGVVLYDLFQLGLMWSYATEMQAAACECSAGWKRELAQSWPVFRLGVVFGFMQLLFAVAYILTSTGPREKLCGQVARRGR